MAAAANPHVELARALIQAHADVNAKTNIARTPLMFAAESNPNVEVIQALVQAGADVNAADDFSSDPSNSAPTAPAAERCQVITDHVCVSLGGATVLMHAALLNPSLEILRALIQAGAHVNTTATNNTLGSSYANRQTTALYLANKYNGNPAIGEELRKFGGH